MWIQEKRVCKHVIGRTEHLRHQKSFVCVCIIMYTFSINTWNTINVEAINYDGKKWINDKHLEQTVGYKNLASNKNQYYFDELKRLWRFSTL